MALLALLAMATARWAARLARATYISSLSPFAMAEASCVLTATGSLHRALQHLASARYPHLSSELFALWRRALFGEELGAAVRGYALRHPSKSWGKALLRLLEGHTGLLVLEEQHARLRFREEVSFRGAKGALLAGWLYFSPLLLLFAWALGGELAPLQGLVLLLLHALTTALLVLIAQGERARLVA